MAQATAPGARERPEAVVLGFSSELERVVSVEDRGFALGLSPGLGEGEVADVAVGKEVVGPFAVDVVPKVFGEILAGIPKF